MTLKGLCYSLGGTQQSIIQDFDGGDAHQDHENQSGQLVMKSNISQRPVYSPNAIAMTPNVWGRKLEEKQRHHDVNQRRVHN